MNHNNGKINVGGQAVIEGVMMRSPDAISVAVRKPSGEIVVKKDPFVSLTQRYKLLNLPIFRGGIALIETLILGIRALAFSGDVAIEAEDEKDGKKKPAGDKESKGILSGLRLGLTVAVSFALGLALFFYLPLILTDLLGIRSGFWFNLVDGGFRLLIFLLYLLGITMLKDIRRIFQYHGAEHKSIYAFENQLELTIPNAQRFSTLHPRCGTSFLLFVMVVSILVFVFLGKPDTIGERLMRLLFVPVIGGISYELIRLSGKYANNPVVAWVVKPGLWLQRITTKEPTDDQVEVALIALKSVLDKDFSGRMELIEAENVSEIARN